MFDFYTNGIFLPKKLKGSVSHLIISLMEQTTNKQTSVGTIWIPEILSEENCDESQFTIYLISNSNSNDLNSQLPIFFIRNKNFASNRQPTHFSRKFLNPDVLYTRIVPSSIQPVECTVHRSKVSEFLSAPRVATGAYHTVN